jgi:hypothetical protein
MTDDLVKRLRYTYEHGIFTAHDNGMQAMPDEAADRIAALEAEIERLREALGLIIENENAETGYGNSSAKIARAALGDWKSEAGDLGGDHVR